MKKKETNIKKHRLSVFLVFALSLFALTFYAQTDKNVNEKRISNNGTAHFITFKKEGAYKSTNYKTIFKEQLGLKQTESFVKLTSHLDDLGINHEKFQLFEQGVKVEFATYTLHSKNDDLKSMSGNYYDISKVNIKPSISPELALEMAMKQIGAKQYLWENKAEAKIMEYDKPKGELVIFPVLEPNGKATNFKLAYKFDIYATIPLSRGDVYIDANTGQKLFYNATIKHLGEYSHGKGLVENNKQSING